MPAEQPDSDTEKKTGSSRTLWIILGAGGVAAALLASCCCGVGVWMFYPWNGVGFSERGNIVELHNQNRQGGREHDWIYLAWDGADLTDNTGQKVRVVRVKYHARGTPDRVLDQLYLFRNGQRESELLNPFGDAWKTDANGLNWRNPPKKT